MLNEEAMIFVLYLDKEHEDTDNFDKAFDAAAE